MKEINKLEDIKPSFQYEDILYKNYIPSYKHPRMSIYNRAAQFSSFAALTGYEDSIKEESRFVENKKIIDEDVKDTLDNTLYIIKTNNIKNVTIKYFIKDKYKLGGIYKTISNKIKKIDEYNKEIILENNIKIKLKDIIKIDIEYNI